ncbi:hypothetical protein ABB37_09869 [Leptomonas pyrrhocoris]|uniref:Uncharacterized protein n=1 Tax=Leptomonas pyrrhocoris TaxID=157538 RepID=A0A0M9FPH7_LEPPY|nr:hypothetical protein ABB37_09869 [Leptomonas pyrrhocoris]KPA73425.1 hypothetical protein ABB37_09869 [Leptomonas pyrrhocoris]|eukprot:XP_015651864.1 hypothetical protein ABB37_09869 [Leptomonas pyrrhocoris]
MQVLSEAVPMTNGEVYALVRRRRDERNAARHPPFGLQPVPSDSHAAQLKAAPQRVEAASASAVASGAASVVLGLTAGGSSSGNNNHHNHNSYSRSVTGRAMPADALDAAVAADAASAANQLAAPLSGNLVVLLTEVTVLNYLANHASLTHDTSAAAMEHATPPEKSEEEEEEAAASTTAMYADTLRCVYGPTSVYDDGVAAAAAAAASSFSTLRSASAEAAAASNEALIDTAHVAACYAALTTHCPGTKGHVRAAMELLEQYEELGRGKERTYAAGIRRVVRQLWRQQLWAPPSAVPRETLTASAAAAVKLEKTGEDGEEVDEVDGGRRAAVPSPSNRQRRRGGAGSEEGEKGVAESGCLDPASRLQAKKLQNDVAAAVADAAMRPSAPLLLEPTPLWGPGSVRGAPRERGTAAAVAAAQVAASSYQPQQQRASRSLLSEAEVMQLVVGRPARPLDVYRLLDGLDGRLQYNEEAIAAFVEGVTAVCSVPANEPSST